MALSKTHFETFAKFVKERYVRKSAGYKPEYYKGYSVALKETAEFFATMAAKENPRFDRARFMAACGLEE